MRNIETEDFADIDYPAHPEIPMSSSQYHGNYILLLSDNLQMIFQEQAHEVAVFQDIQWYPVAGHPEITTAPDVMVCFGIPQDRGRNRNSYMQFREDNVGPSVVFEIDSSSNTSDEVEEKREWYETYGVEEYYWIFSETPEVRVFIRDGDQLLEQTGVTEWTSARLGIRMDWSGSELQIYNPDGSLMRPTRYYATAQRQRAELAETRANQETQAREIAQAQAQAAQIQTEEQRIRAEQEAQAAQAAQQLAMQEAQRAEQEAQRAEQEAQRAEQEAQRAEQEAQRAEQEAQARVEAEQRAQREVERNQRLLEFLRQQGLEPPE